MADLLQRDANPSDVIDQAIIVPLPDDDRDTDITRSKRRERRRRGQIACRGSAGQPVQQVPPRRARGVERGVLPVLGRLVLGKRHQRISQTQSAHVMRLGGLHDLDKRLVETAAPQRDEHAFGGVEDPRPRPARILRPARRVQLALTSCVSSLPQLHTT